jgi:hypothetical protein
VKPVYLFTLLPLDEIKDKLRPPARRAYASESKGGLTGHVIRIDAGVEAIVFPPFPITEYLDKGLHIGIFFEVPNQLQHKEAYGIIGKSCR